MRTKLTLYIILVAFVLMNGIIMYGWINIYNVDTTIDDKLIYPDYIDFSINKDTYSNTSLLFIRTKMRYPSMDIFQYYKQIFATKGWHPVEKLKNHKINHDWFKYIDKTEGNDVLVHRFSAMWRDRERKKVALLVLSYESIISSDDMFIMDKPNNDIQKVSLQIMPAILVELFGT